MHYKFGVYLLMLESAAWSSVALGQSSDKILLGYLLAHAAAAALFTPLAHSLLPARLKQPRRPILLIFFGIGYAIPLLGFVGLIAAIVLLRRRSGLIAKDPFNTVSLPPLDPHQRVTSSTRQVGMASFLANANAPVTTRMHALVALQSVPGSVASPLLRSVLSDPSEDIRLLAYGMLDSQEKRLNKLIHEERSRYSAAKDASTRALAAERLSGLYWELVYQELVQGDLRTHALLQSLGHAEQAIAHAPNNAAMHLRQGRLRQLLGQAQAARLSYERALDLGLPRTRIVPYLAELSFNEEDYASVRRWMQELGDWRSLPRLRPIIEYWQGA